MQNANPSPTWRTCALQYYILQEDNKMQEMLSSCDIHNSSHHFYFHA